MKEDLELYHMLIDRLLNCDHLNFIKVIVKVSENTEIIENLELYDQAKLDPLEVVINKKAAFENLTTTNFYFNF